MAKSTQIQAVLFDKDGTLIDFADTFFGACKSVIFNLANDDKELAKRLADAVQFDLRKLSCPATSQIVGGTSQTIAALWAPILGHKSIDDLSRDMDIMFDEYTMQAVREFDFTRPVLEALSSRNIPIGLATNDSQQNARNHLQKIRVERFFSFIAGYDSGYGSKPEPGMVQQFSLESGCECAQIAMVGDAVNDLLAARNAGAIAIAVTSGIADASQLRPYADVILNDISQLPQWIADGKPQGK